MKFDKTHVKVYQFYSSPSHYPILLRHKHTLNVIIILNYREYVNTQLINYVTSEVLRRDKRRRTY